MCARVRTRSLRARHYRKVFLFFLVGRLRFIEQIDLRVTKRTTTSIPVRVSFVPVFRCARNTDFDVFYFPFES